MCGYIWQRPTPPHENNTEDSQLLRHELGHNVQLSVQVEEVQDTIAGRGRL